MAMVVHRFYTLDFSLPSTRNGIVEWIFPTPVFTSLYFWRIFYTFRVLNFHNFQRIPPHFTSLFPFSSLSHLYLYPSLSSAHFFFSFSSRVLHICNSTPIVQSQYIQLKYLQCIVPIVYTVADHVSNTTY